MLGIRRVVPIVAGWAAVACSETPTGVNVPPDPIRPDSERIVQIVGGNGTTCALTALGATWCWGANEVGEAGDSTTTPILLPKHIVRAPVFVSLVASQGNPRTCGITSDGAAYCWGYNDDGEIGDGSTVDRLIPTLIGNGLRFTSIASSYFSCGIGVDRQGYCWGTSLGGQLGTGVPGDNVSNFALPQPIASHETFQAIVTGEQHSCALSVAGVAYCWGWGLMVGRGDSAAQTNSGYGFPTPAPVAGTNTFRAIAAGLQHTCALALDGTPFCWGKQNQFASNALWSPTELSPSPKFAQIAAGGFSTCALTSDDRAFCWNIGNVPAAVPTAIRFVGITVGVTNQLPYACGITKHGAAYCWGANSTGVFGSDTTLAASATPVAVAPFTTAAP